MVLVVVVVIVVVGVLVTVLPVVGGAVVGETQTLVTIGVEAVVVMLVVVVVAVVVVVEIVVVVEVVAVVVRCIASSSVCDACGRCRAGALDYECAEVHGGPMLAL